ncbi:MAG TPA: 16S rRNA (cytidine(1402)-2'-O)-methyltransferase [Acidobacteriaceae bacterium]|nr:16S rRNA (cytidine(1402)-2'-O)-methyltransferase [Acidobacteriaceae bacterium]
MHETSSGSPLAPGLYLVATPIGNLEDITLRALRVLREADRIACEDTRQTRKLLDRYGILTPVVSSHQHNEAVRSRELLEQLRQGARIAVVTDAGTPGISDPGIILAEAAIDAGVAVYAIPGPSALLAALVASGLDTERFFFAGFLPPRKGKRRTALEELAGSLTGPTTLVLYEAPHRILDTLEDLSVVWGPECRIAVARELTKMHEEYLRGTVRAVREEMQARVNLRGEMVLVIGARPPADEARPGSESVRERLSELERSQGLTEKDALKRLARERGVAKSELWRELQREKTRGH